MYIDIRRGAGSNGHSVKTEMCSDWTISQVHFIKIEWLICTHLYGFIILQLSNLVSWSLTWIYILNVNTTKHYIISLWYCIIVLYHYDMYNTSYYTSGLTFSGSLYASALGSNLASLPSIPWATNMTSRTKSASVTSSVKVEYVKSDFNFKERILAQT